MRFPSKAGDKLVYGIILGLGVLEFVLSRRSNDFYSGDATYIELARSLIETGSYGFDFRPETMLPPGFPAFIALLCVTVGCRYAVLVRAMSVFATLGLIVSYELLRREQGRAVATGFCLLLASSPILFQFSTQGVGSDLPYFFTSMATLLLVTQLDTTRRPGARVVLWPLCGILLVVSLLIRSAGIALLTGLVAWLTASWFVDRPTAWKRLKTYLPLLLIGVLVQALWMNWVATHEVLDWRLVRGYPHSYVAQLSVKDGNHPELGAATLSDIPPRVARNVSERATFLVELLTRKKLNPALWFSPMVLGPVLLVLAGVGCSLGRGGGRLQEWYFVSYEAMYVLWPWYLEIRFFVPVAPLACLYLWRGGEALLGLAFRRPRVFGVWSTLLSLPLGVYAGAVAWTSGGRHPILAAIFWALVVTASAWMVWSDPHRLPTPLGRFLSWSRAMVSVPGRRRLTLPTAIAAATVAILVATGIAGQLSAARENLTFDVTRESTYPDAEAGWWIQAHTATTAVVMARHLDVVFHHGKRKVVWFPPLSDPQQLMDGIRRHRVEFVVVISREWSYWLPPDQDSFEPLVGAYPKAFKLVHEGPRLRIFQVVPGFLEGRSGERRPRHLSSPRS